MNAAPWVVDLPSVASSSTTLHLLHSPFSSTPLYAFLSSPPPLRAFPPRFSVLFLFSTRFPPFSFVGLGVGRPRPLPAFFRFGSIHRLLHRTPLSSVSLRSPRFYFFPPIDPFGRSRRGNSQAKRTTISRSRRIARRLPSGSDRKTRFHPLRCLSDAVGASIAPVGNRIRAQTVRGSGIASFDAPMGCDGGPRTSFESLSREMGWRWKNCQRAFLIPSCSRYALLLSSVSASLPPSSSFSSSCSPSGTSYLLHRFLVQGVAQTQYVFAMRARYYDVRCIHVIVRVRDA